jgi:hypothetical protein
MFVALPCFSGMIELQRRLVRRVPCIQSWQRFHGLSRFVRLKAVEIQKGSHPIGTARMQTTPINVTSPKTSITKSGD